jgi:hypothetical protein
MVEIVVDTFSVYTDSIFPAIKFKVKEQLDTDTIPLGISGCVLSDDRKYMTNIVELPSKDLPIGARQSGYRIIVRDLIQSRPHR